MTPKILFLSDGYLSNGTRIDATRKSFLNAMPKRFAQTIFLKTNDYFVGVEPKSLEDAAFIRASLDKYRPDLVLSINAAGLSEELLQWTQSHSIPTFTWYWDAHGLFPVEMVEASLKTQIFHACSDNANLEGVGKILSFSGAPRPWQPESERQPDRGIVFLGTCWHILRYAQAMSLGLRHKTEQRIYRGAELYEYLLRGTTTAGQHWETVTGISVPYNELFNALTSIRRARILAGIHDQDLHIYGDWDWETYLWPVAPELIKNCHRLLVSSQEKMGTLMRRHKISLNVFHLQNRMGGANFRIMDSATHSIPILSDYNAGCVQLFPEGEAALYFRDEVEARENGKRLMSDASLRDKLSRNASNILHEGHTHEKRLDHFLSEAGLAAKKGTDHEMIVLAKTMTAADLHETATEPTPASGVEMSSYYNNELFFLPRLARKRRRVIRLIYRMKDWSLQACFGKAR